MVAISSLGQRCCPVHLEVLIENEHCGKGGEVETDHNRSAKCPCEAATYTLHAEVSGVNLKGTKSPVTVGLIIGDNTGTTQINAEPDGRGQ